MTFIRSIITAYKAAAGKVARFSGTGRIKETFKDREAFQQFGLRTGLPEGTQALLIKDGQNIYLIASESKYTIKVENGETAIYNQWGDNVILKKNHTIEINAEGPTGGNIMINAKGLAGNIVVKADGVGGKVIVDAANIYFGEELIATAGGGVVTTMCACITGGVHPMGSTTVMSKIV